MVCPYCSTRSAPNAITCAHCGVILKKSKSVRKTSKPFPWRRVLLRALSYVVAAIAAAAFGHFAARFLFENDPKMWIIFGAVGAIVGVIIMHLVITGSLLLQTARLNGRRRHILGEVHRIEHDREKKVSAAEKSAQEAGPDANLSPELRFETATIQIIEGQVDESLQQLQQVYRLGLGNRADFLNNVGVAFAKRGQMNLSVERFQQAIRVDARSAEPRINLVYSLLNTGDEATINRFLTQQDGALRTLASTPEFARRLGLTYAVSGRLPDGRQMIEGVVKQGDRDAQADAHNDLGIAHALAENYKEATAEFQQAIHLDPGHAPAIANSGVVLYRQKRYDEAIQRFEQAVAVDPHSGLAHSLLGAAYCRANLYNEGIREFREARLHEMYLFEPNYNLGKVYIDQEVPDQAQSYLARAHEINSSSWQTMVAQAVLMFKQSLIEKAQTVYRQAKEVRPDEPLILSGLALLATLDGKYDEGEELYRTAQKISPEDLDLLTNFSWHYLVRSDSESAAKLLEQVMRADKKAAVANNNMGLCQLGMGAYETAQVHFKQALQSDPNLHTVHYNLGNVLILQKATQNAIDSWERGKKVETGNADLHTNLGVAYYKTEKFEKASLEFRRVLHLRQERAEDYVNLGLTFARMKRHKEAIEQFELGIQIDPSNPMIHSNLGLACFFANRVEDAMREWREVTALSSQYAKLRGQKQQSEYDDSSIDYVPIYISERALYTQPKVPDYTVPFVPGYSTAHWELMIGDEGIKRLETLKSQESRIDRAIRALKA